MQNIEGSSILQSGSNDLSGGDRVQLPFVSEEDMKLKWSQFVWPKVERYLELAGTPMVIGSAHRLRTLPTYASTEKIIVSPDIG